jgi:hypothetical protein
MKRRAYDNKLMELSLVPDYENIYYYNDNYGHKVSFTPTKWIITKVYDWEAVMEN